MGKKVWILLLFLFGITVGTVSAHSVLVSSQPKNGAVVEDSLSELKLTFNTKIEKILSLKVIQKGEGQSFTPKASTDGKVIKVTLSKPLENGSYDVDFRVIGEDGHAVEGGFSFKVKVNHSSDHQPKEKPTPDQKTQDQSQGDQAKKDKTAPDQKQTAVEKNSEGTPVIVGIVIALAIVILIVLVMLLRKKK